MVSVSMISWSIITLLGVIEILGTWKPNLLSFFLSPATCYLGCLSYTATVFERDLHIKKANIKKLRLQVWTLSMVWRRRGGGKPLSG